MKTHHHRYVRDIIARDLVDRETIAGRLGVTQSTVRRWSEQGTVARGERIAPLPCVPIVTSTGRVAGVLYYWPTVEQWARRVVTIRRGTIPDEWTQDVYAGYLGTGTA
jgi:hypothetical protein